MSDGFSDQILGGVGTLIRKFIKSRNYVAGSAGWQITNDGNAEFNNLTARGSSTGIIVGGPVGVNPEIKMDVTPEIVVYNAAGAIIATIDSLGLHLVAANGSRVDLQASGAAFALFRPNTTDAPNVTAGKIIGDVNLPDNRPNLSIQSPFDNVNNKVASCTLWGSSGTNVATKILGVADDIFFESNNTTSAVVIDNGILKAADTSANIETWHKITGGVGYQNGFTDRGAGYAPVQYRLTAKNEVQIVGSAQTGTVAAGTIIFTLPVGYRPTRIIQMPIQGNAGDAVIELNTNGDCKLFNYAAGAIGINGEFTLDTLI